MSKFNTFKRAVSAWTLPAFLALVFLLGGGSRGDILSLVFLRPIAAMVLVYALARMSRSDMAKGAVPVSLMLGWLVLIALQLVPLPPLVWTSLPGREPIVAAFDTAGLSPGWKPLSVSPMATFNSLQALFVPVAVLLLYLEADETARRRALLTALVFVAATAIFGVMQIASGNSAKLHPFRISNPSGPIGLFANRNHQGAFLAALIPMVFALAEGGMARARREVWRWLARAAAIALLIIVVMTGSRVGTLLALAALATGAFLTAQSASRAKPAHSRWGMLARLRRFAIPAALLLMVAIIFLMARGYAFERFAEKDNFADLRFQILPIVWQMAKDAFPLGWGFGTFPQVYMIYEPVGLMSEFYVNRAHNDWIEILIEGGIPALLLALGLAGWVALRAFRLARTILQPKSEGDYLRGAALTGIIVLVAASAADYPLRTPSCAALLALLLGCVAKDRA